MIANRATSWFRPFFNLDRDGRECPHPHGLIEKEMPARVVRTIHDLRREFASRWDPWNCGEIAPAWVTRLRARHPRTRIELEGDPGSDGATSGYDVDGYGIRPHVWVTVGPRHLIFDPTAYQFADGSDVELGYPKPGICRDRYRKDGRRFTDLR
jgi:hypothetical protein